MLVEYDTNVDIEDNKGFTPLMNAAQIGNLEEIKLLLDKGCDILHKRKQTGKTALHSAAP